MVERFITVVVAGGPVMVALALVSLLLYKHLIGLLVFVRQVDFGNLNGRRAGEDASPREPSGAAEKDQVLRMHIRAFDETVGQFKQLVGNRLKYGNALLVAAPLLGLLGTVMGMLDTFHGLSLQLGHETSRTVSDGVSRALITTQTGLMIAIPALFLIHWVKRETQRKELMVLERKLQFISRMET